MSPDQPKPGASADGNSKELASLLRHLKESRGFDLTGYKRATLERRVQKRLQAVGVGGYTEYEDYLEVHPDEFTELFDALLINVTSFFRDKAAWDYLREEALPTMLADTPGDQPIRVWSAGCASGEEAYTAAILLAEAMGDDDFGNRVKIYATDIDEDALTTARHAVYPRDALKSLPDGYLERYFEPNTTGFGFRADLRRSVIFGRNDLVQDAPISRIDLLISRNTLMYFTPETQARILGHFNFSLRETGFLFLGKSEMLITHSDLFTPINLKCRVFRKVQGAGARDRLTLINHAMRSVQDPAAAGYSQLMEGAADISPVPQLAVDDRGILVSANLAARRTFGLGRADTGRPLQDLEISYRPVDLRASLDQARDSREAVQISNATLRSGAGQETIFDVEIAPVLGGDNAVPLGVSVTFTDVTAYAQLDEHHKVVERQLEGAYEELQSTVEELETTNEELQSTNEELETMNEELQSTNDELEAMNEEQRERASELDRLNLFLEGILGNLGVAVIVLDVEQRVQLWNGSATDLWGVQDREAQGEHFLSLDIGFPMQKLKGAVKNALSEKAEGTDMTVEAINRRGRKFTCEVRVLPMLDTSGARYGAMLLMNPARSD